MQARRWRSIPGPTCWRTALCESRSGLSTPVGPEPDAALAVQIEAITEPAARSRALALFDEFSTARRRVAHTAGDPERLGEGRR
jgi:hypothetical protein